MASIIKSDNGVSSGITGIVQSADSSGQLALQTTTSGGTATTAVTIDTSQNVGIGTTSPAVKLQVQAAATPEIRTTDGTNIFQVYSDTTNGGVVMGVVNSAPLVFRTNATERARFDSSGDLLVGTTSGSANTIQNPTQTQGNINLALTNSLISYVSGGTFGSGTAAAVRVGSNSVTGRSINAGGTVNVGGLDYAEYMTKSSDFTIAKGDVVGINANGKLTNVFADAVSFVVKSTNPSYVGGDVWGTPEALGLSKLKDDATDEEKATFNAALEAARQNVDRIAFSGQVPVNVTGAMAGQYIVPIANQDGSIGGQAVSESAMTLQQYMQSVGKVISVVGNVTTIIVKVA